MAAGGRARPESATPNNSKGDWNAEQQGSQECEHHGQAGGSPCQREERQLVEKKIRQASQQETQGAMPAIPLLKPCRAMNSRLAAQPRGMKTNLSQTGSSRVGLGASNALHQLEEATNRTKVT